jgi:hypothetical protein
MSTVDTKFRAYPVVQIRTFFGWTTLAHHSYEFTVGKSYESVGLRIAGVEHRGPWRVIDSGNVVHQQGSTGYRGY